MSHIDDSINQHQNQQDQPDSSSEISMFTLITPEGQTSSSSSSQVVIKNDTNNNNNDRNNNNGKTKLEKLSNLSNDDDGNNNQQKQQRHGLQLNGLQRYHVENCTTESLHPSSSVHPHHLLLLQQQQQMGQNQMLLDKQSSGNLIPVSSDNSPSLIVLQPSGQPGTPYSPFPYHYAAGKYRIICIIKSTLDLTQMWTQIKITHRMKDKILVADLGKLI